MDVATTCGGADSPLTAVAYSWRIPHLTGYRVAAGGREMSVAVSGAAASSMKTATTCRRTACSRSAPARIMPAIAHGGHGGDGLSSSSAARDLADERGGVVERHDADSAEGEHPFRSKPNTGSGQAEHHRSEATRLFL